jgi:pilus assembly protein CpaB
MTRGTRTVIVVAVALVMASAAAWGVYETVKRIPGRIIAVRQVPVVAATTAIPPGTRLTAENIKVIQWPAEAPLPGAHATPQEVIDRGTIAPLLLNEPITESKLATSEAGAGLPPTIPPGLRAISVRVNEVIGVGLYVGQGTRVDVLATFSTEGGPISRAVVENVQIIAAGTAFDAERAAAERRTIPPTVVTLAVTPEQAERIALVATNGQILLALRNPVDGAQVNTRGVRLAGLLIGGDAPPVEPRPVVRRAAPPPVQVVVAPPPPPPPPKPYTVEAIRAAKRSEERVRNEEATR